MENRNLILEKIAESHKLTNYEIICNETFESGDGIQGQISKAQITNKAANETIHILFKHRPKCSAELLPNVIQIYNNEMEFYKRILPALNAYQSKQIENDAQLFDNTVKYYCSYPETDPEYIVMEDVTFSGYNLRAKKAFFDQEHLEHIFRVYGRFHALNFMFKKQQSNLYRTFLKNTHDSVGSFLKSTNLNIIHCVEIIFKELDRNVDENVSLTLKNFIQNFNDTYLNCYIYNGKYSCLTHGDCWSNNMLFKYSKLGRLEDFKLIDFQAVRDSTPVHDLSYIFYSGASIDSFEELNFYLKIYHQSFVKHIRNLNGDPNDYFSFETLKNEWKENAMMGLLMGILLWRVKYTSKEIMQKFSNSNSERNQNDCNHYWQSLTEIDNDENFKVIVKAILIHAVDYGIIHL